MSPLRLPVRPAPTQDEAMDSYFERLAEANGCRVVPLTKLLRQEAGTGLRFLNIGPAPALVNVLASWVDTSPGFLQNLLLTRYPVVPEIDSTDRHGTRSVVAHGWVTLNRSQACPVCLREGAGWKGLWRLAWTTACVRHECLLETRCPRCALPLRAGRLHGLRASGAGPACGNPQAKGPRMQCRHDLGEIVATPAPEEVLRQQEHAHTALHGKVVDVAGTPVAPGRYLELMRTAARSLYHQPSPDQEGSLSVRLRPPVTATAGPSALARWTIPAPEAPHLRARAFSDAHNLIGSL